MLPSAIPAESFLVHPEPTSPARRVAPLSSAARAPLASAPRWSRASGPAAVPALRRGAIELRWPAVALAFLFGSLLVRANGARWGVPVISGDQALFLPIAREWLANHRLQHPFWAGPGGGSLELDWHGWLYPLVVAGLPSSGHAQTLLFGAAVLPLAAVAIFAMYAWLARLSPGRRALLLLLVGAIASYQIGRPESLFTLLWGAALALERWVRGRRFDVVAAILLGVAIVTQPAVSMAACAVFAMYASCTCRSLSAWAASVATVVGGGLLIAFGLTGLCTPLRVLDWLHGMRANLEYVAGRTDTGLSDALLYFVVQPTLPLAILYLVLAGLLVRGLCSRPRTPGLRRASAAAAAALASFVALTALRVPATVYDLVALAPPIVVVALQAAARPTLRLALGTSAVAATLGLALGALSVLAASTGVPITELQAELRALQPCSIAADPSSWLAVEEAVGRERMCSPPSACPARAILQANSGLLAPPPRLGDLPLHRDRFHHAAPSVLGLALETTRKDYAYALYGDFSRCAD